METLLKLKQKTRARMRTSPESMVGELVCRHECGKIYRVLDWKKDTYGGYYNAFKLEGCNAKHHPYGRGWVREYQICYLAKEATAFYSRQATYLQQLLEGYEDAQGSE